jgi:hypothetical protein
MGQGSRVKILDARLPLLAAVTGRTRSHRSGTVWMFGRLNVGHDCRDGSAHWHRACNAFRAPGTEDDDAIVGMAMDVRDLDRNRLERDRADLLDRTVVLANVP